MPCQHHHQGHHHSSCCHGCCSSSSSSSCCSSPPNPRSDQQQLLQTLILLQSQSQPQTQTHFLKPLKPHQQQQHYHYRDQQPQPVDKDHSHHQQTQSLLHSLLRRVANLESSLSSFSVRNPPRPKRQSIKHLAAIAIQTHFRRFLARRSRTLRELKLLASIKSEAANIRSSLSDRTHKMDPQEINRKAVDLLLQLDSIQTADPMIREGKRSLSRELVRVTEFVDKVLIRDTAGDGAGCTRGGRRVRFAENGNEGEVFDELPERDSEVSEGDEDEETHMGNHGFYQCSDGEESPRVRGGGMGLSPPLPVKMESARSKKVGIASSN